MFVMGDWSEPDYLREKARIDAELAQLRPVEGLDIAQAAELLETLGGVLAEATDEERKSFFQTVLDEVYVKNKKVVAVRPKPNYYNLLCMSPADPTGIEPACTIRKPGAVSAGEVSSGNEPSIKGL
jgi:hypothetical protein